MTKILSMKNYVLKTNDDIFERVEPLDVGSNKHSINVWKMQSDKDFKIV